MNPKIIFAEDHRLVRQVMIPALKDYGIETIGEAQNGLELLELLKTMKPDIVLLDIQMPVMDGCEALQRIRQYDKETKVIILSTHNDSMLVQHMYKNGANAFINKDADIEELVQLIMDVYKGKHLRDDRVVQKNEKFSNREVEVSSLMCEGKSNKEIADELKVTNKTVEAHKKNLFNKTKTKCAVEFVGYIFRKGLNYLR